MFLGLSLRETQKDMTYLLFFLRTFIVRFSLLMTSFQSVFWSSLYFLLALLFARFSPLKLCRFLFCFALLSPYFSVPFNFLARFSRLTLLLLLFSFFMNLNYNNFLRLTRLSFAGIVPLLVDEKRENI